ncbi:hypothetical protein CALCODRAFT_495483 [Calocera cornea HHB12733]|uniref:Amidohydrolase-related domain-containing protein n=1 Tax=Calocera cornea HHB12733 TaxID=1353952 RepID=A0A165GFP3_9BASI|nr:hypothetical protein CALCODRAFT_495483 [Calocera cornea HHB12733]
MLIPTSLSRSATMLILTSKVFDPEFTEPGACFLKDQTIVVDKGSGLVAYVRSTTNDDLALLANHGEEEVLDLRGLTVLPGFIDAHVHFFLHPMHTITWNDQVTKQSVPERVVRAVTHAKATILAGFTTVRDLGTEGAEDADLAVRKTIALGLIPGPRYFCVTRAIVSTGSYGPRSERNPSKNDVDGATGADAADGPDECRKAVRRQIGAGADWIKIYADNTFRFHLGPVDPVKGEMNLPLFAEDEVSMMIQTAHSLGVKITAHASMAQSIKMTSRLGIDSVEHGPEVDQAGLEAMAAAGVTWVPTLSAFYLTSPARWPKLQAAFTAGLKIPGLKIAAGGDTGVMAHGENALELQLMYENGMPWRDVLRAATLVSGELVVGIEYSGAAKAEKLKELVGIARSGKGKKLGDNALPLGLLKPGYAADIIALQGDLEGDFVKAIQPESVRFVMKGGKVFKEDGEAKC